MRGKKLIENTVKQILEYLSSKYGSDPHEIHVEDIKEAIAAVRGPNHITIRKWMWVLEKFGYFRPINEKVWEKIGPVQHNNTG